MKYGNYERWTSESWYARYMALDPVCPHCALPFFFHETTARCPKCKRSVCRGCERFVERLHA